MSIPKEILKICDKLKLPLAVRSNSLYIFHRLKDHMEGDISCLCAFIGCKLGDVHGNLRRSFGGLENFDYDAIIKREAEAYEHLGFEFTFPCPYTAVFGLRMVCKRSGIEVDGAWMENIKEIDELLEDQPYSSNDMAIAILNLREEDLQRLNLGSGFKYDYQVVRKMLPKE